MSYSKDLSIIIISHNTRKLLYNCLTSIFKSIKKSGIKTEVIVVDNASTDQSRSMVRENFPQVNLITNRQNIGFGKANNRAIAEAQGKFILLLNSDIVAIENAIPKLFKYADRYPNSFIGGKLFNVDGSVQTSAGKFFSLPVVFAALFLKGDKIGLTRFSPNNPKKVDWVAGACIIARKQLFDDGLLFDETVFMYMEEVDLLYRARLEGHDTRFYPHAHFIHVGAASSSDGKLSAVVNIFKGLLFFYEKHYSKLDYTCLKIMLKTKARLAQTLGAIISNNYLKNAYGQASDIV